MSVIKYKPLKNKSELQTKIDDLDKLANLYLKQIRDLYVEDLYFMSIIDKSIKLIDSFLFAFKKRNITVLATLTRVQMDCALRAYASSLAKESGEFCDKILFEDKRLNTIKDSNNHRLTDKYLCEKLGQYLNLPVYELYKKVCGFVHFSSISFHAMAKAEDDNQITMLISRNNRSEDEDTFERLSIELADHFYFFGRVLIEDIFASWLEQKKGFGKKPEVERIQK